MPDNPGREENDHVLLILKTTIRILGLTNREVERRLGMTPSYLGRIFSGTIVLRVEHVLAISRALGLAPAEFFELVYPRRPEPPSEPYAMLRKLLRDMQTPEPERPAAATPEEALERKIRESVRQALRDLIGGR